MPSLVGGCVRALALAEPSAALGKITGARTEPSEAREWKKVECRERRQGLVSLLLPALIPACDPQC